jgi:FecR protein
MTISRLLSMLGLATVVASMFLVESAAAESKVRIVRLSDVEGTVQIERAPGEGLEKAFLNLPIVQGSQLKTGNDGRAEVEFEDGSTARIGPNSQLAFVHLSLGDNGEKLNTMQLNRGTFYGSVHEKNGDEFQLKFAQESITVPQIARYRVVIGDPHAVTVAVFKGKVEATGPTGTIEILEKHSAKINPEATDSAQKHAIVVAKNYDEDPLDGWDRQQNDYHERYATTGGSDFSSPYGYGISDLNYYGAFNMIPGYGYAWQPFFANAGWNPFMDGAWAFYPGAGYMWVSGYPWGWMPYYYGSWANAPGYGWIWQPGSWNSWSGVPRVVNFGTALLPSVPASGHQTVMVGKGLMANAAELPAKLTITPGSAGFGVPRGSVNRLSHVSRSMDRNSRPRSVWTERPIEARAGEFGMEPGLRGVSSPASMSAPTSHSAPPSAGPHK